MEVGEKTGTFVYTVGECLNKFHPQLDKSSLASSLGLLEETDEKLGKAPGSGSERILGILSYLGSRGGIKVIADILLWESKEWDPRLTLFKSQIEELAPQVLREQLCQIIETGRFGEKHYQDYIFAQDPKSRHGEITAAQQYLEELRLLKADLTAFHNK